MSGNIQKQEKQFKRAMLIVAVISRYEMALASYDP